MSIQTKIEWCRSTFNPWWGCTKVSPGCDNCYAERDAARFGTQWGPGADRRIMSDKHWREPLRWNKKAKEEQVINPFKRWLVFSASMADVFDNEAPEGQRERLWQLIRDTPHLTWLILTKRIGNAKKMLPPDWGDGYPNVWIGATMVNQEELERDIHKLAEIPAVTRFLSIEPMQGAMDLVKAGAFKQLGNAWQTLIHWVIVGGESGPNARPMLPSWPVKLMQQCKAAGVPFFFKQWGEWHTKAFTLSDNQPVFRQFETFEQWVNKGHTWVNGGICLDKDGKRLLIGADMMQARDDGKFPVTVMHRVGKKAAGSMLDGMQYKEFPDVT